MITLLGVPNSRGGGGGGGPNPLANMDSQGYLSASGFGPGGLYPLGHWHEINTTSDVTRLFWRRQNGRQFSAQPANFERLKKQVSQIVGERKVDSAC